MTRTQRILMGAITVLVLTFVAITVNPPHEVPDAEAQPDAGLMSAPKSNPVDGVVVWCDPQGIHVRHPDGGQDNLPEGTLVGVMTAR